MHELHLVFAGGLVVGGVTLSAVDLAAQATQKTHDAIVSSGAVPLEIKVYQGPDIQVPAFFGFVGIPTATFHVVATAQGSPVAAVVILAAIVALIVIALFFVYLIVSTFADLPLSLSKPLALSAELIAASILIGTVAFVGFYGLGKVKKAGGIKKGVRSLI